MKRIQFVLLILLINAGVYGQIVADHTVVDRYVDIPQGYIDEVKKMWLVVAGESHSEAYRVGLSLLEGLYPGYAVSVVESGEPEPSTDLNLRASCATWGDITNLSGWIYSYGEEDWFTSLEALTRTESGISYCNSISNTIGAIGFGWCYDPMGTGPTTEVDPVYGCHWWGSSDNGPQGSRAWGLDAEDFQITGNTISLDTYLDVTQDYIDFCAAQDIPTKVFFTTGPVDNWNGLLSPENMYQAHLKYERIRSYVNANNSAIFFDYADILCFDDGSDTPNTVTWDGHVFPTITPTNLGTRAIGHIGAPGALRLAKAMWYMLARIAGWDGNKETEWTGAAGNDWDNDGNWSNGVPGGSTDVIIPDVINDPAIAAGVEAECNNMDIAAGAMLTIESDGTLSGSLIVRGTSTGTISYNRQMPNDELYHYISSPVDSPTLPSVATFWAWSEPEGDWGDPVTANTAGAGYTMQAGNSLVSFTGTVITDNVTIAATSPYSDCDFPSVAIDEYSERPYAGGRDALSGYGGGGWNLLGNPFASALDATAFISSNGSAFDQNYMALYIYNGDTYAYIGSELTGWENADGLFGYMNIQVGQGFFVAARCNTSEFIFTSEMQVHNTSVPYTKSAGNADRWPGIQLKAVSGSGEASTLVIYNEQMSAGLDPGYDIGQMNSADGINIYTTLALHSNSVNYARQALPKDGADTFSVPLGIDLREGGSVTFSALTAPLGDLRYWLKDRVTGSFTDLSANSYTVTLPADTYGSGRFFILASANTPTAINQPETPGDDLRIWVSGERVIISGVVREGSLCEVFDISGRKMLQQYLADGGMNIIDMPVGLHGFIVVRVSDGEKVDSRKVVIR